LLGPHGLVFAPTLLWPLSKCAAHHFDCCASLAPHPKRRLCKDWYQVRVLDRINANICSVFFAFDANVGVITNIIFFIVLCYPAIMIAGDNTSKG